METWPLAIRVFIFTICVFSVVATPGSANKKPPAAPVNLNTATSEDLQTVPGIGPATAEKILQMRKNYGAFKSVDDLLAIKGIGPKRLEKMRKYLTVGKPPSSNKPSSPKPSDQPPKASLIFEPTFRLDTSYAQTLRRSG